MAGESGKVITVRYGVLSLATSGNIQFQYRLAGGGVVPITGPIYIALRQPFTIPGYNDARDWCLRTAAGAALEVTHTQTMGGVLICTRDPV
jgi:hypothetical protein